MEGSSMGKREIIPDQECCLSVRTSQTLYCANSECSACEEGRCMSTGASCFGHIKGQDETTIDGKQFDTAQK